MDSVDIVPDQDEHTPEVVRMPYTEEKMTLLQERQEQERKLFELKKEITRVLEREVLQEEEPPIKKRKTTNTEEKNEAIMEQGQSSRNVRSKGKKGNKRKKKNQKRAVGQEDVAVPKIKPRQTKMSESTNKTRIAIDCRFDSLLSEKAVRMLSSQMGYCYSQNRTMAQPFQLYFTNFKDKTLKQFEAALAEYQNWDVFIKQETLTELHSLSEVVYLCPESENIIQTLDDDKIYVIGGFVAHGPHEGIVFDRVKEAGFSTAWLPIEEHFKVSKGYISTITQVFKIISTFSALGCWKEAIKISLPKRKGLVEKGMEVKDDDEGVRDEIMGAQRTEVRQHVPNIKPLRTKMSESTNKTRIAIDCSFESIMSERTINELCLQIQKCYKQNSKMTQPFQLYFTHFKDKTLKCFNDDFPLYKYWDVFIKQETLTELYNLSEVVYLCPDSENVIQTLDDDKIYVIGGFVRHSTQESVNKAFDRVREAGFSTARLPIEEYFTLTKSKENISTVSHLFKIISSYSAIGCWKKAIKISVPKRKGLIEKDMGVKDDAEGVGEEMGVEQVTA